MNIGDKVRFLNDVGGGIITAFRPGGIVLVEDKDGFDVPIPQNEVVVIEDAPKAKKTLPKAEPAKEKQQKGQDGKRDGKRDGKQEKPEVQSLNGKEYLQSKAIAPTDIEEDIDENMEARIVRLEMTIQKLEARIARLEAENNLRKNEKLMERQAKQQKKAQQPTNLGDLQIL